MTIFSLRIILPDQHVRKTRINCMDGEISYSISMRCISTGITHIPTTILIESRQSPTAADTVTLLCHPNVTQSFSFNIRRYLWLYSLSVGNHFYSPAPRNFRIYSIIACLFLIPPKNIQNHVAREMIPS